MAHAFWHLWGKDPFKPDFSRVENLPLPVPPGQEGKFEPVTPTRLDKIPQGQLVDYEQSGTGPAFEKGFWQRHGESQMDPRTIKILRDREEALAAEGAANEAARQENARNRMLASTRYISPEMKMALLQDPTGAQGLVAKQYAPPKEDDDWFKKMMQYSFMQSMMPEPSEYSGTSTVQVGPSQRDFFDIPYYGSGYPGGTNV